MFFVAQNDELVVFPIDTEMICLVVVEVNKQSARPSRYAYVYFLKTLQISTRSISIFGCEDSILFVNIFTQVLFWKDFSFLQLCLHANNDGSISNLDITDSRIVACAIDIEPIFVTRQPEGEMTVRVSY